MFHLNASNLTSGLIVAAVSGLIGFMSGRRLQSRQFNQHQKIEKEYPLYLALLGELIELRIALHDLVGNSFAFVEAARDKAAERFNKYKSTLRSNQPVMHSSVFAPAREIESLAREIIANADKITSIEKGHPQSARGRDIQTDEQHAESQIRIDDENDTSLEAIDRLFEQTKLAISNRVGPS